MQTGRLNILSECTNTDILKTVTFEGLGENGLPRLMFEY